MQGRRGGGGGGASQATLLLQALGAPRLGPFPEAFPVLFANLRLLNQRCNERLLCFHGAAVSARTETETQAAAGRAAGGVP